MDEQKNKAEEAAEVAKMLATLPEDARTRARLIIEGMALLHDAEQARPNGAA